MNFFGYNNFKLGKYSLTIDFPFRYIVIKRGNWKKYFSFHWWGNCYHEVKDINGNWMKAPNILKDDLSHDDIKYEEYPYTYILRNGKIQNRSARINVERRTWTLRFLPKWIKWPRLRHIDINIEFNKEIGEKTGSWKGGCVGCMYDIKPGETPYETLKRMEKERIFN